MRKLFVAMLVATFMVSSCGLAFGSGFSDVAGTKYESAVSVLVNLGILTGFPDGTFQPDATMTRSQFATVAVKALGLGTAADFAKGPTQFPDVDATHWASGFINIAVDQGLILGFTDGTFRPDETITQAQALTMLVRLLGYEPAVAGTWPIGYLVKGYEIGLSAGVSVVGNAPAPRGMVAQFLENSLEINLMLPVTVGGMPTYAVDPDKTLLDHRLGFAADTGVVNETSQVLGTALAAGKVLIGATELTSQPDLHPWLGYTVKYWKSGSTIVHAKNLTPASRIVTGTIAAVTLDAGEMTKVKVGTTTYDVVDTGVLYNNFFRVENAALDADDWDGADVEVVLNAAGEATFVKAVLFDESLFVTEVSTKYKRVKGIKSDAGAAKTISGYDVLVVVKNGELAELADVAEEDIAHYFERTVGGKDYAYLFVVDDTVEGTIDEAWVSGTSLVVSIDGEAYTWDPGTVSPDLNDSFAGVDEDVLADYVGEAVTLYLNRAGKARHAAADIAAPAPAALWGIITQDPWTWVSADGPVHYFRMRGTDGTIVRYEFKEAAVADFDLLVGANTGAAGTITFGLDDLIAVSDLLAGDVVKVTLKTDGTVATVVEVVFDPLNEDLDTWTLNKANKLISKVADVHKLDSVMIFDVVGYKIVSLDTFLNSTFAAEATTDFYFASGDLFMTAMRVNDTALTTPPIPAKVGVVLQRSVTADGTKVKLLVKDEVVEHLIVDGTTTLATYDGSNMGTLTAAKGDLKVGDLVEYTLTAANKYHEIDEYLAEELDTAYTYYVLSFNAATGHLWVIKDKDDDLSATADFLVMSTSVLYDCTGTTPVMVDTSWLVEDAKIQVFAGGGTLVTFIKFVK